MLHQPLLDQLQELKLTGMRQALQEQLQMPDLEPWSFTDRLGLLIDRERTERANRRLQYRLQKARLQAAACPEDLDYRPSRGLDKTLLQHLLSGRWLAECELSAEWSHFDFGVKEPLGFRRKGASGFSP